MTKEKLNIFVADDGDGVYNIFDMSDFNSDGYLIGHENEDGYHISDFDIVYRTSSFENACRWVDKNSIK